MSMFDPIGSQLHWLFESFLRVLCPSARASAVALPREFCPFKGFRLTSRHAAGEAYARSLPVGAQSVWGREPSPLGRAEE